MNDITIWVGGKEWKQNHVCDGWRGCGDSTLLVFTCPECADGGYCEDCAEEHWEREHSAEQIRRERSTPSPAEETP